MSLGPFATSRLRWRHGRRRCRRLQRHRLSERSGRPSQALRGWSANAAAGTKRPRAAFAALAAWLALGLAGFFAPVGAQGSHASGAQVTGSTVATLTLQATADLGSVLELALPLDTLAFDLRMAPGDDGAPTCVAASGEDTPVGGDGLGGGLVAPGGTDFRVEVWPLVSIVGGEPLTSYPPPPEVGAVVCYQSFVLRAFANEAGWLLGAARLDVPGVEPLRSTYIGAVCEGEDGTGLRAMDDGMQANLAAPTALTQCHRVLVVVAVKVGPHAAGTSASVVRYTLLGPDADFAGE